MFMSFEIRDINNTRLHKTRGIQFININRTRVHAQNKELFLKDVDS